MISSLTDPILVIRNDIAYGSTKVGMVGFTKSLATGESRHGATASVVALGLDSYSFPKC
jgi:NAD(P)-dependent dehydrogenase (short-subunit alcohol dehydrogenase family)